MQGSKNPPWARSNVNTPMTGMNPQIMDHNSMTINQQGIMPFQQSQAVFNPNIMQTQGGLSMPMAGQMQMNQSQMYPGNVVAYPTPRAMNPNIYQGSQTSQNQNNGEQRVFTGTVTKTHKDFGFIDNDVFYQSSICAKGIIPKINDRVLVEATYNANMPFKWNATRVQVLLKTNAIPGNKQQPMKSNSYNAVPPPHKKPLPSRRDDRPPRREDRKRSRTRTRSRSLERRESRNRRDSPPRKRLVVRAPSPAPKYIVRIPRMPLEIHRLDIPSLSQRYSNMYIPSDFFCANFRWAENFPPQCPLSLNNPCNYHIMHKDIPNPIPNDAVLEPPDADYRFSAKVMLISMPVLKNLYQGCGLTKSDEKEKDKHSNHKTLHPTRLIKFLVGNKGKGDENFAIGGPWSPSLDGENPDSDPQVLVKTAIRTCKALTGIDLSSCTQWYRMVEFYYWRESSGGGGGAEGSRLQSVVLFLPDVWSVQPPRADWSRTLQRHRSDAQQATIEKTDVSEPTITIEDNDEEENKVEPTHYSKIDLKIIKVDQLKQELRARNVSCKGLRPQLVSRLSKLLKSEENTDGKESLDVTLENETSKQEEEMDTSDVKNDELSDMVTDDQDNDGKQKEKALVIEIEDDSDKKSDMLVPEEGGGNIDESKDENKTEKDTSDKKDKKDDKQREKDAALKSRFEMPSSPHIIVYPNPTAKGGKFNCSISTLSLLLDYRPTDNKEHSFELFVFAELFNEMLMRDFGFYIYKTLYTLPEKVDDTEKSRERKDDKSEKKDEKTDRKEEKIEKKDETAEKKDEKAEKKDEKAEKKDEKAEKKDEKVEKKDEKAEKKDEKVEKVEKKDDKEKDRKDDRRDSKRRDRKGSEEESRSSSPIRRGRTERGVDLPPDPYLLLSLIYFDIRRVGYIFQRDLQTLFLGLGLQLSRSQITNLLDKVCVKSNFNYKNLVQTIRDLSTGTSEVLQDLPLDNTVETKVADHVTELETVIATGNRQLLPLFKQDKIVSSPEVSGQTKELEEGGMVVYKSRVVDVGALLEAHVRGERARTQLESAAAAAASAARAARAALLRAQLEQRAAAQRASALAAQLAAARAAAASLAASSKIFHSTLKKIQNEVEAVVNIKYEQEEEVVTEVSNGPNEDPIEGEEQKEVISLE